MKNVAKITGARKVAGDKIQLTFEQKIQNPEARPSSIVGILNKGDERFTQEDKPRYAWVTGTSSGIKESLGIDTSSLANEGDTMDLDIVNPKINGAPLNIQITETTQGTEYDLQNVETRAKRAGKDGEFILSPEGEYIFMKATVVAGDPKHVFIANTIRAGQAVGNLDAAVEDSLNS